MPSLKHILTDNGRLEFRRRVEGSNGIGRSRLAEQLGLQNRRSLDYWLKDIGRRSIPPEYHQRISKLLNFPNDFWENPHHVIASDISTKESRENEIHEADDGSDAVRPVTRPLPSQSTWKPIESTFKNSKVLTVGCFDYVPFIKRVGKGNLLGDDDVVPGKNGNRFFAGPWFKLVELLALRLKWHVQFKPLSAAAFADNRGLEFDIIPGVFRTTHREKCFEFSIPIHRIGLQGVCRVETAQISKEDVIAKASTKILVQPGEVGWEYVKDEFRRAFRCGNVLQIPSHRTHEMLEMLESGKYDLAIADEISCLHFLREADRSGRFRLAFRERLQVFNSCIAVNRASGIKIEEHNEVIREIRNEPSFLRHEMKALKGFEHIERCSLD
ncbi:MAG: transporter substrate-binding domain-containing protein [Verrucomicrobiota bacterium]